MEVLCLFGLFPNEYRDEIEKNTIRGMQNAANKLQWAILNGLDKIDGIDASVVNSLYIGSFPLRYKKTMIPTFVFHHKEKANDINVGFNNLMALKWFSRLISTKKYVKKWAEKAGDNKVLLVYALTTPFVNIASYIKKKFPHIKVCIVVPDLPEYMNVSLMQKKGVYYFLKKYEIKVIKKYIKEIDCYVLLTDAMKEWFDQPIKYTVVEGIATIPESKPRVAQKTKTFLYAGGIKEEYGVVDLVKAFCKINDSQWNLDIYGDGPDLDCIKEMAKDHSNVNIMGAVSNSVVIKAQAQASVLVNPRKNQPFTKYSFPSKIMEYMSSGTPMMAYKLDGMPDDYDGYYYRIEESENGISEMIQHIINLPSNELIEMGEKARLFVEKNKLPKAQVQKIVDLLNSL